MVIYRHWSLSVCLMQLLGAERFEGNVSPVTIRSGELFAVDGRQIGIWQLETDSYLLTHMSSRKIVWWTSEKLSESYFRLESACRLQQKAVTSNSSSSKLWAYSPQKTGKIEKFSRRRQLRPMKTTSGSGEPSW